MTKSISCILTSACLLLAAFCNPAEADIVLTIDTTAETGSFSGSDTGDSEFFLPNDVVIWEISTPDFENNFFQQFAGVATTTAPPSVSLAIFNEDSNGTTFTFFNFFIGGEVEDVTITGTGESFSYAGLSPVSQAWFEGQIGGTMPVIFGTGFSPISIQGAQGVPEPSSLAALFGVAMVGMSRRRRQR